MTRPEKLAEEYDPKLTAAGFHPEELALIWDAVDAAYLAGYRQAIEDAAQIADGPVPEDGDVVYEIRALMNQETVLVRLMRRGDEYLAISGMFAMQRDFKRTCLCFGLCEC